MIYIMKSLNRTLPLIVVLAMFTSMAHSAEEAISKAVGAALGSLKVGKSETSPTRATAAQEGPSTLPAEFAPPAAAAPGNQPPASEVPPVYPPPTNEGRRSGRNGSQANPELRNVIKITDGDSDSGTYQPGPDEPTAVLRTSLGDITVRLFKVKSPETVENFIGLASGEKLSKDVKTGRVVKRPFYNGMIFHRVIKDFMIQTGCPFGTGRGGSGELIVDEHLNGLKFDSPGLLAMAPLRSKDKLNTISGSNSSQFFITATSMPELNDDKYTIFGKVISGMSVVKKIAATQVGATDRPIRKIYLISIEVADNKPKPTAPSGNSEDQTAQTTTEIPSAPAPVSAGIAANVDNKSSPLPAAQPKLPEPAPAQASKTGKNGPPTGQTQKNFDISTPKPRPYPQPKSNSAKP
jgi:peptidyl-prolyl cis-trans isomerase A (cyclophilin A)